jgi:spore coat polysaccharide biosynthesis protein SpsF
MRVGAVVFARMSSSRLPGKALLPIGRQPLLGWVLERLARVRSVSQVVVATSTSPSDDTLADFSREAGIEVYRGPLDNVVERAVGCAHQFGLDAFARVCGDRAFLEPADIDGAVRRMMTKGPTPADLVTNTLDGHVPPGLTAEVVRTDALAEVLAQTSDRLDLEHLTRYFYRHPEQFRIVSSGRVPPVLRDLRFVVDTPEDLDRARWIVERLEDPATAPLTEIAVLAREWNAHRLGPQYA